MLDTSRIEAGTFSYRFEEVDLGRVVDDAVEAASLGQHEVPIVASVDSAAARRSAATARGSGRCSATSIENAVKYSPEGDEVEVSAGAANGAVDRRVRDAGRASRATSRRVIFEKFGRADVREARSRAPGSASSSPARSRRRTAARST